MTQKRYNEIPKRQKCVNKEEPYIGGAEDIVDDTLGKPQSQVNQERIEDVATEVQRAQGAESTLDGKISAEKTRAEGVEGGLNTRLQTVEQLAEISISGGDIGIGTAADFESDDPSDLAKVPTIGAVLGSMDDEPIAGSDNLVKSGGVDKRFTEENESNSLILSILNEVKQGTWETRNNIYPFWTIGKIEDSGIISDADKFPCTKSYIQPREGHTLRIVFDNTKYRLKIFTCTLNDGQISSTDGGTWNTTGTALYNYNATKGYMIQVAVASGLSGYPTAQEATFGIIITDDDEKTFNLGLLESMVRSHGYIILSAVQTSVFEEDTVNKKIYYKTTNIVVYVYGKTINKTWTDIKTQINDASRFVDSAAGKGDCLRLDNNEALVLNVETGVYSIVNKTLAVQPNNIVLLVNDDGVNYANTGLFNKFITLKNINSIFNHPDDNEEWKVEEDHTNKKLYLKLSGVLCNRGYINTSHTWAQIKTSINDDSRFVNAPSGDDNYLRLDQGEMFIYRFLGGTFNIVNASNYNIMSDINLATNYNGCLRHGQILKSVIRKNTERITFLERNDVNEAIVAKTQAVVEDSAYDYANCFKFAMISDVHGNTPAFNVAIELSKWGQSNALLVGGDLNLLANEYDIDATNKYFTELARKLKDVECNVFTMRGNHDGLLEENESVGNERFTNAMFNSVLVKPFMSSANAGYFFKDFEDYKIRFICLNSAENIFIDDENVKGRRGFSQEQITWFENTLASTPDGYTVITSSHHMICKTQPEGASSAFHNVPANYQDILDAILYFKTNKPLCTHAFHVHGHVHQNYIYTYDGIQFVSTASCGWPGYNMDNYCVDTVNKKVGIMNLTYYTRHDREFTYQ